MCHERIRKHQSQPCLPTNSTLELTRWEDTRNEHPGDTHLEDWRRGALTDDFRTGAVQTSFLWPFSLQFPHVVSPFCLLFFSAYVTC